MGWAGGWGAAEDATSSRRSPVNSIQGCKLFANIHVKLALAFLSASAKKKGSGRFTGT